MGAADRHRTRLFFGLNRTTEGRSYANAHRPLFFISLRVGRKPHEGAVLKMSSAGAMRPPFPGG